MTLPRFARAIPHTLNPAILPLARRLAPLAVVHHHGRRSGQSYQTPVMAMRREGGWIVGLPYGTDVDWARNLRAEHGAALTREGAFCPVVDVQMVPASTGMGLAPRWARPLMRVLGVHHFITMRSPSPAS